MESDVLESYLLENRAGCDVDNGHRAFGFCSHAVVREDVLATPIWLARLHHCDCHRKLTYSTCLVFGDASSQCDVSGCQIAYAAVCHVASTLGLGRHLTVVEQHSSNLIKVALLYDISETLAIMARTLGKTSFAVTLLRIVVRRWMVILLWFVIIMNLVNILAVLFVSVQYKDPQHLWNPVIPSECWPDYVLTNFSLFVRGKLSAPALHSVGSLTCSFSSASGPAGGPYPGRETILHTQHLGCHGQIWTRIWLVPCKHHRHDKFEARLG